jgi:hypothetical protein
LKLWILPNLLVKTEETENSLQVPY